MAGERWQPRRSFYRQQDRLLSFVEAGRPDAPLALLVHGSPGDAGAFTRYLNDPQLQESFHLISVDRPGFGRSQPGQAVGSLQLQALLLSPLLERDNSGRGAVLVGHSLGASVIARMAMDFPDQVRGLLLIAPALDPELETPRWYNHLATLLPVRWVLPTSLDTSNREILSLGAELARMLPLWSAVRAQVIVIQGARDRLVHPANADFAERVLAHTQSQVRKVADAGHFILWNDFDLIREAILEFQ